MKVTFKVNGIREHLTFDLGPNLSSEEARKHIPQAIRNWVDTYHGKTAVVTGIKFK